MPLGDVYSKTCDLCSAYFSKLSKLLIFRSLSVQRYTLLSFLAHHPFSQTMSQSEKDVIIAFLELTVKLNEASFKPLFRRLYDWAFVNGSCTSIYTPFFHMLILQLDSSEHRETDHLLQGV